jgi:arginyl-tRNA synthetase
MEQIIAQFDPTPEPKKLAWNVLAWNFLHVARPKNVKFTPEEWTKPEAPGMYITYTYARIKSALKGLDGLWFPPWQVKGVKKKFQPEPAEDGTFDYEQACKAWDKANPDPEYDLTQSDADLIGFANQYHYNLCRCIAALDPAILANYAHDLAAKLGVAYHSEKIQGGRYGFKHAIYKAVSTLRSCMWNLGMFDLEQV